VRNHVAITRRMAETCLEEFVWLWANGDEHKKEKWMKELYDKDVGNIQGLKKLARGDRWERFLEKLDSDLLVEHLKDWKNENLSQSKLNIFGIKLI
jgi:hypothetical protein